MHALIPARAGSKRIKSKNIVDVCGHPLIAYTIAACKLSKNIDRVIVSTDCEKIAEISLRYGAEVPFMRPKEYATDTARDKGFLEHFFSNVHVEHVLLMRPTTPLRNVEQLDKIIDIYTENIINQEFRYSGFRSMTISNHSPYKMFKVEDNVCSGFFDDYKGNKFYTNLPNNIFPKSYTPNGYCDLVTRRTIQECNSTFGKNIFGICTEKVIDIDDHFDLDIVRSQIGGKYDSLSVHLCKTK